MHSRIYQISEKPIHKCDYIDESYYYDHWFTSSIADYVSNKTDRADDIEWLKESCEQFGIIFDADEGGEYFIIEDKLKYFSRNIKEFKAMIEVLSAATLEHFASMELGMAMHRLKSAYDDEFGFYVQTDNFDDLLSLDEFVRHSKNGDKFYIGATIDYHF